jgi:hypothetical protein
MMKDDPSMGEKYTAKEIEDKREELEWKKLLHRWVFVQAQKLLHWTPSGCWRT